MAKQLTVRGVDERLERAIRAEAERSGQTINRTVLGLLRSAMGLVAAPAPISGRQARNTELDHLAGTWSAEEADAFDEHVGELRQIDAELWR